MTMNKKLSIKQLLLEFLKIGSLGFGGGMAILALMERELIKKKEVMPIEEFLHGVAFGQVLGPFAVNTAIFIGTRLYGFLIGILCAIFFMLPSVTIVIILSFLYFTYHQVPSLQTALTGLGPIVIALILSAGFSISKKSLQSIFSYLIAIFALILSFYKINSAYVLLIAGAIGILKETVFITRNKRLLSVFPLFLFGERLASLPELFIKFLKTGLVFFGGGFVLVPILHEELVLKLKWLTEREFIDGVAISNLTPGPIAVLATFSGYKVFGLPGAIISTTALFLPGVLLMLILTKGYNFLKDFRHFKHFLSGVTPAVVGLIFNASIKLAPSALNSPNSYIMLVIALILLIRLNLHPAFVLALGAFSGIIGFIK